MSAVLKLKIPVDVTGVERSLSQEQRMVVDLPNPDVVLSTCRWLPQVAIQETASIGIQKRSPSITATE